MGTQRDGRGPLKRWAGAIENETPRLRYSRGDRETGSGGGGGETRMKARRKDAEHLCACVLIYGWRRKQCY